MLYPLSVAVAGDNALLVADRMLPGLLKLQAGKAEVFFQGKKTFRTPLNAVRAVAVAADGTVHAADSATRDVFKFVDGQPVPLTQGKIGIPVDIAFDPSGDLFVSDLETQRIWRVPAAGGEPIPGRSLALAWRSRSPRGAEFRGLAPAIAGSVRVD
jgi:hypothetical protein